MDRTRTTGNQPNRLERTLAHLKIISRLLGHELHAQNAPRLTFSREEINEIQTSIDLFIEDVQRSARGTPTAAATREVELPTVEARVN
jgi:ribosome-binding factor A